MLFNSIDFAVFLPLVFAGYWLLRARGPRPQNAWLLLASYVFYGWWDWRYLGLIVLSSGVDYWVGRQLGRQFGRQRRRLLLWVSLGMNLGMLAFFKYFDFFVGSFVGAFTLLGGRLDPWQLGLVLPVGISFYTFQTLSYTIDVYRGKLVPTEDALAFFSYVSFFPQLVAGPIERAGHLLPQFLRPRSFDYPPAVLGMRQILWGLFKKMVIADTCAEQVNLIWANYGTLPGGTLLLGAFLFAVQIYGDFSGYSDIAIGTARLFGFDLRRNFAYPYFSRDIAEFWRRWHISLSSWFRDYVYIPLGGSRRGRGQQFYAVWVVFLVSGLWHGAAWTFVAWGAVHAGLYSVTLLQGRSRRHLDIVAEHRWWPSIKEAGQIALTLLVVTLAWVLFRSSSLAEAGLFYSRIFSPSLLEFSFPGSKRALAFVLLSLPFFFGVEWLGRRDDFALAKIVDPLPGPLRRFGYAVLAVCIVLFSPGEEVDFIYFQF